MTSFTEYMKVSGEATAVDTDKYRYPVIRDLSGDGQHNFKVGDATTRMGNATQGKPIHPVASGDPGAEYGTQQPGGTGSNIEGGWLVLEGAREVGPYFAVARRRGPVYNQFDEVVRIGNLRGISVLDATKTDNNPYYGAFIGDASAYLAYDADTGLRIKTRSGATAIEIGDGITTDQFTLALGNLPDFTEDRAALFLWDDGGAPEVGIRMKTSGVQRDIPEIASVDHTHTGYILTSGLSEWDELTATPATPSATKYRLYFKDDGRLYRLNDLGVEVDAGQGPQGEQGPEGPAGTPGTSYLGAWNDTTNYEENDIVSYGADTWVCLVPNTDQVPSYIANPGDPLYWAPLGTYLGSVQLAEVIHGMDAETAILDDDEFISSSSFSQLDEVPEISTVHSIQACLVWSTKVRT